MSNNIHTVTQWLEDIGVEIGLLVAGILGATTKQTRTPNLSIWERCLMVFSGGAVSVYVTPLVGSLLKIENNHLHGVAFILGYIGLNVVEYIIIKIHQKIESISK
jgi:hypothetical protein